MEWMESMDNPLLLAWSEESCVLLNSSNFSSTPLVGRGEGGKLVNAGYVATL